MAYTPGYAPTEQISGSSDRWGPWTDFYALGATLYNLLTIQGEAAAPSVIFMCFGMNDVGVFEERVDRYIGRYSACIRRFQISMPEAVIYVQAILPVTDKALKDHSDYQYIDLYNAEMEKMCKELGAYFIDASFILEAMPELYAPDGVHPRREYYPMWLTYLADIAGLSNEQ